MFRYRFEYVNGTVDILEFESDASAWSFASAEGDILDRFYRLEE